MKNARKYFKMVGWHFEDLLYYIFILYRNEIARGRPYMKKVFWFFGDIGSIRGWSWGLGGSPILQTIRNSRSYLAFPLIRIIFTCNCGVFLYNDNVTRQGVNPSRIRKQYPVACCSLTIHSKGWQSIAWL